MPSTTVSMGHPVISGYLISHSGFEAFYVAPSGMSDSMYFAQQNGVLKQEFITDYSALPDFGAAASITFPVSGGGFVLDLASRGTNNPASFGAILETYPAATNVQSTTSYQANGNNVVNIANVGQATNPAGITPVGANIVTLPYGANQDEPVLTTVAGQNATNNNNVPVTPVVPSASIPFGRYYKGDSVT